jgi:hypothetical protein
MCSSTQAGYGLLKGAAMAVPHGGTRRMSEGSKMLPRTQSLLLLFSALAIIFMLRIVPWATAQNPQ